MRELRMVSRPLHVLCLIALLLVWPRAAAAQVLVQHGFEDGTTQGWVPRGGATLSASDEAALAGARSLKTTGRTAAWNGPSLSLLGTLEKGGVYQLTASVRLVSGQPPSSLKMTVQRTDAGATSDAFDQVSPPALTTDAGWVTLEGQYSFGADVSALLLYVESDDPTSEYYLDEFEVSVVIPPPDPDAPVVLHDFEDGTLQGWAPRGSAVLANSDQAASTGARSLLTTGRTAAWNGPSLELLGTLERQAVYEIRADVRLVAGQPATTLKITIQRQVDGEASPRFDQVTPSADVTDAGWVTLSGGYTFDAEVTSLQLYVESPSASAEYYLDDFTIDLVTPPPDGPPDQSGIASDFEDGTAQGWGPRGGSVAVAAVTDDAHTGSWSLETTGRTATWNGPSVSALGKMHPGSRYRISVWVKLLPGQDPTQVRVSVQRDFQGTSAFDTVVGNTEVGPDEWTLLTGLYDMVSAVDGLSVYVETATDPTASFYIDDFSLEHRPPLPIQTDIPALKDVLADHFELGGAIEPELTLSERHSDLITMHLSSLTAENAMKFGALHPAEDTYDFEGADRIADFARANGLTMRGHTLIWHSQNPAWLFQDESGVELEPSPESRALMLQRLEDHIRTVVARYDDVVTSWDVVNEVIDASQPDGLRRSRWYELTGTDYIDRAFQVAREVAGPDAKLYINDFSTTDPDKLQALLDVVLGLEARGIPVDGVGHQMHVNVEFPPLSQIREAIETFSDLGLDNQITEMDVSVYTNSTDSFDSIPEALLLQQGYRYRDVFELYRELSDGISSVTLWGIADDNTWLKSFPIARLDLPLLFDEELQAKHAYWGVVDPLELPVLTQRRDVVEGSIRVDGRDGLRWETTGALRVGDGQEVSADVKLLWDAHFLYVLADVEDGRWSRSDRVEVFVDGNDAKGTSYDSDDVHYSFERFDRRGHHGGGRWGSRSKVVSWPGGYRVEARIPLPVEVDLGSQIGFDVRVTDANSATAVAWNDFTLSQDDDPSKWGTLTLVGDTSIAQTRYGTPVVDGFFDPVWHGTRELETATPVLGAGGATARFRTLWDRDNLYVLAVVADPLLSAASSNPWEQDSIEVFVDLNNGKTEQYESDDAQYRVSFQNEQSTGGAAGAFVTAVQLVEGGYVVEAAIPLGELRPRRSSVIGFDLQVNDDGLGDGVRTSVRTWNDPTGESFRNTSRLGVLRLVGHARHHGRGGRH